MKNKVDDRLSQVVADARHAVEQREKGYRQQALKMYPHICGRCAREFSRENLHELTVHHRDHDHDNNPADGSNWELLCLYCHDNEHQRQLEAQMAGSTLKTGKDKTIKSSPFAGLKSMIEESKSEK